MSPLRFTYIAAVCLLLIFATQTYLVYDHFDATRSSLTRESDVIIEKAFKKELNQRNTYYKHVTGEDTIKTPPPITKKNTVKWDIQNATIYKDNLTMLLELSINEFVSETVPMNFHNLDSITESILQARNIHSEFLINIVDPSSGNILKQSNKKFNATILAVPSKLLQIDLEKRESLQLVLINPFGVIIKRMSLMLISSFILSIICMLAFRFLLRTLARQKQLVTFKNEFLATIAHELKRPVASLTFNLDCLTMPVFMEDIPKRELLVSKSIVATTELNDTINMIVALAKLEEGLLILNKQTINLKKIVDDLKIRFSSDTTKRVVIRTEYESGEYSISGDAHLLSQCFANLIDNAIKYSNEEVLIIISLYRTSQWMIVSIKDNGFGILEDKIAVIFDKYTRLNPDNEKINGFGIGLNYVKTIVEEHKGMVKVKSQPGEGSEFSVLFPV